MKQKFYVVWETQCLGGKMVAFPKVCSIPAETKELVRMFDSPIKALQNELHRKQDTLFKLHDKVSDLKTKISEQERELNCIVNLLVTMEVS